MPTSARTTYDGIFGKRRGDVGIAPYEAPPITLAPYEATAQYPTHSHPEKGTLNHVTTFLLLLGGVPAAAARA